MSAPNIDSSLGERGAVADRSRGFAAGRVGGSFGLVDWAGVGGQLLNSGEAITRPSDPVKSVTLPCFRN